MITTEEKFDIGDRPVFTVTFLDTGTPPAPVNPGAITFQIQSSDGTLAGSGVKADAANPTTGTFVWTAPVIVNRAGRWRMKATATSPDCAVEGEFEVNPSAFG